jgi:hypothetical protein
MSFVLQFFFAKMIVDIDFYSPIHLEKCIVAMHDAANGDTDHAHILYPSGKITTTKGGELLFRRSEFIVLHAIPGLKLDLGTRGHVLLPPTMTQEDIAALHRQLSIHVCLEILARTGAFPQDSGCNVNHTEEMLLTAIDGEPVTAVWNNYRERRDAKRCTSKCNVVVTCNAE